MIKQCYRTPLIRKVVIWIDLALRVYLSRILRYYFALKLPVIGSRTVECYGFWNFKSGVAKRYILHIPYILHIMYILHILHILYILQILTAELQTVNVRFFQRKIQLSGFSAYPDGSPAQLIRMSGVLL